MDKKYHQPKDDNKAGSKRREPGSDSSGYKRETPRAQHGTRGDSRPFRDEHKTGSGENRSSRFGERRPPAGGGHRPAGDEHRPFNDERRSPDGERRSSFGERRPPRFGDHRPPIEGGSRPPRDDNRTYDSRRPSNDEQRSPDGDHRSSFGERRPPHFGERRPPAEGERRPPHFGERRPPAEGEHRPPRFGEHRPPAEGERRPPRFGERRPPAEGERRPPRNDNRPSGDRRPYNNERRSTGGERGSDFNEHRPPRYSEPRPSQTGDRRPPETEFTSSFQPPVTAEPAVTRIPLPVPVLPVPAEIEEGAGLPDRLEGRNPILEAIKAGRTINKLWVAKKEERPDPSLGRLIAQAREAGAVIIEVDRRALDAMSTTHSHQGVIAQVAAHEYVELDDLIKNIKDREEIPFLLILAELQESYNLGSILRIADAAGVQGVIIPMRRSVGLDAAVAKASAGAIEHVPVARVGNLSQTILTLKEAGFWIAGTDADGKVDYHQADWSGPLAILVGSEGEGLSPILRRHCDFLISIPMHGKVNSLNAAVAAGIVTFEAASRRQSATGNRPARPQQEETADVSDTVDNGDIPDTVDNGDIPDTVDNGDLTEE